LFSLMFLFSSINFVSAYCSMPSLYRENGSGLDLISGIRERMLITIDQANYPSSSWITYKLQVKNKNSDKGILVYLQSEDNQNNIIPGSVFLNPDEKGNLSIQVWIRKSADFKFRVTGICDDGTKFDNFIKPELEIEVKSYENVQPQNGCSLPPSGCDMNSGLYVAYYCENSQAKPIARCIESCCKAYAQQFGDEDAFCSADKHACIAPSAVQPTEGSIAFLCSRDDCSYENDVIVNLRLLGFRVDGKSYKSWSESELGNYDIIACYHQSACKLSFNSPAYNQHVINRKPFLEISMSRYASAAYEFGYLKSSKATPGKDMFFVTAEDEITSGYNSYVNVVSKSRPMFAVIKDENLDKENNPELKDLADSGNNKGSIFFKVDETVGHGKYVFIGWLSGIKKGEINADGEIILRRTLSWLKSTSPISERKKIAFLCSRDDCSDKEERGLIKILRKWGFLVEGKSLKSWGSEISSYNLIVCRNSKATCQIPLTSSVYNAYTQGVPFLEIPESSKAYAGEIFGIVSSKLKRSSNYYIEVLNSNQIVSGLEIGNSVVIFPNKRPIFGVNATGLNSAEDIAHIPSQPYSTLFTANKYAFIGFLGKSNVEYMNQNAKEILRRTVDWLID